MTDTLACITPILTSDPPGRPDGEIIRQALLKYSFLPEDRRPTPTPEIAQAVRWLEKASLPLTALDEETKHTRAALEGLSLRLDGKPAATSTYERKRAVFHHALIAVTYVGKSRGPMMAAMFACMYFGGLRSGEAAGLRKKDCHLPEKGWGLLTLEKIRPESNKRYTDSGESHDERGLKHRDVRETRLVPIPPEQVEILRRHIEIPRIFREGWHTAASSGLPLPTEHEPLFGKTPAQKHDSRWRMVGRPGLEPGTYGLKVRSSAN